MYHPGFTHHTKELSISSFFTFTDPHSATTSATEVAQDFVFVVGYGRVGRLVCEVLDRKSVPYAVLESSPHRATQARNRGLPVYFGA